MQRIYLWLAVLLGCCSASSAAEIQPIAVLSFSGYERVVEDLEYLGQTAKNPQLCSAVAMWLQQQTGVERLEGLDRARPLGILIGTDGLVVAPIAFFPVRDLPAFLASLAPVIGEPAAVSPGVWKIGRGELTGYIKQHGDWASLAQSIETVDWAAQPPGLLGSLPQTYDAALQINLQRVPEVFRTLAIDLIRLEMKKELPRRPDETPTQHALREQTAQWRFRLLEQLLTQSEQITLGWSIDKTARQATFDLLLIPKADSRLASQMSLLRRTRTRFAGLSLPDSPLTGHFALALDAAQVQRTGEELAAARPTILKLIDEADWLTSDDDKQTVQGLVGSLWDAIQGTVQTGAVDIALAAQGSQPPVNLVAAAHVGQGDALEQMLARLADLGKNDPRFAGFQLDVARLRDVPVHAVLLGDARNAPFVYKLLGESPRLLVACQKDTLWLAAGPQAQEALQRAMDRKESTVAPVEITARLGTLTTLAANVVEPAELQTMLRALGFGLAGGDDRLHLTLEAADQSVRLRITAQEGVLRAGALGLGLRLLWSGP